MILRLLRPSELGLPWPSSLRAGFPPSAAARSGVNQAASLASLSPFPSPPHLKFLGRPKTPGVGHLGLRRGQVSPSPHLPRKEAKAPLGLKKTGGGGQGSGKDNSKQMGHLPRAQHLLPTTTP